MASPRAWFTALIGSGAVLGAVAWSWSSSSAQQPEPPGASTEALLEPESRVPTAASPVARGAATRQKASDAPPFSPDVPATPRGATRSPADRAGYAITDLLDWARDAASTPETDHRRAPRHEDESEKRAPAPPPPPQVASGAPTPALPDPCIDLDDAALDAALAYRPSTSAARRGAHALVGRPAPELNVSRWVPGAGSASIAAARGKVVVLYAFQSWCPGCQSRGFPVTERIARGFSEEDVEVVYLQTPFEGHSVNDYGALLAEVQEWSITRPAAQDGVGRGGVPHTMRRFRTGGTPWHIVIDRDGDIRFNDFTRDGAFLETLVCALL